MKKTLALLVLLLCTGAFAQPGTLPKIAVYVTGDLNNSEKQALGTEMLNALVRSGRFTAVERSAAFVAEIEREQTTQRSGVVDDGQIGRLGKRFGVQYVCVAGVAAAFGSHQVSARILNVETAEIGFIGRASGQLNSMTALETLSASVISRMFDIQISDVMASNQTNPSPAPTLAPPPAPTPIHTPQAAAQSAPNAQANPAHNTPTKAERMKAQEELWRANTNPQDTEESQSSKRHLQKDFTTPSKWRNYGSYFEYSCGYGWSLSSTMNWENLNAVWKYGYGPFADIPLYITIAMGIEQDSPNYLIGSGILYYPLPTLQLAASAGPSVALLRETNGFAWNLSAGYEIRVKKAHRALIGLRYFGAYLVYVVDEYNVQYNVPLSSSGIGAFAGYVYRKNPPQ